MTDIEIPDNEDAACLLDDVLTTLAKRWMFDAADKVALAARRLRADAEEIARLEAKVVRLEQTLGQFHLSASKLSSQPAQPKRPAPTLAEVASDVLLKQFDAMEKERAEHWGILSTELQKLWSLTCALAAEVRNSRERIVMLEEFLSYLQGPMLAARRTICPRPLDRPQNVCVEWRTGADTVVRYFELIDAAMAEAKER